MAMVYPIICVREPFTSARSFFRITNSAHTTVAMKINLTQLAVLKVYIDILYLI